MRKKNVPFFHRAGCLFDFGKEAVKEPFSKKRYCVERIFSIYKKNEQITKIKYNKLVISLFETDENPTPYHWRFIPDPKQLHHREFFISNFAKDSKNYGVFTETNADRFDADGLTFKGRNLFNYTTPAAYPLPLIGKTKAITEILEFFKPKHLFGVGRWGEHLHHNHDVCIKHVIDFVEAL